MSNWKTVALVAVGFNVGVIYTTACSNKSPLDSAAAEDTDGDSDDTDGPSEDTHGNDTEADTDGDDPPGDTDDEALAELTDQVSELAASLAATESALASLQASVDCYVGHQIDDTAWIAKDTDSSMYPGYWDDIDWNDTEYGEDDWGQGENSDAMFAYEACF